MSLLITSTMNLPCVLIINLLFIFSIAFSLCNSLLQVEGKQCDHLVMSRRLLAKHTSSLASKTSGQYHSIHQDDDMIEPSGGGQLRKQASGRQKHKQVVPHHSMPCHLHANAISSQHSYKAQILLASPPLNKNAHKSRPFILEASLNDNTLSHQSNYQSRTILAPPLVKYRTFKPNYSSKLASQRGHRSFGSKLLELEKDTTMDKTKSSQDQPSKESEVAFHVDYQVRQTHPPSNN